MFVACQKSQVTIKLKFYYSNLKNAVETTKIAVDSCYVLRQFLTPLPSIDFREIRGLLETNVPSRQTKAKKRQCVCLVICDIILNGLRQCSANNNKT